MPLAGQGKLPLGFGGGSFAGTAGPADVEGQITFAHAIGYRAFEDDDRTRRFTMVLLSDTSIDERQAQDDAYHAVFDARGRTSLEAPEKANYTRTSPSCGRRWSGRRVRSCCEDWAKGLMRGRLASPDTPPVGSPCLADVYIAALAPRGQPDGRLAAAARAALV